MEIETQARERAVQRIEYGQQRHVTRRELAAEALLRRAIAFGEALATHRPSHQAGQLLARLAGGPSRYRMATPLVGPFEAPVAQPTHHLGNERIALAVLLKRLKLHLLGALQKRPELGYGVQLLFVHIDHNGIDDRSIHSPDSYLVGNTTPRSDSYYVG